MAVVSLREVTRENVKAVCKLQVRPDQQSLVAPNGQSLAEARFADDAWVQAIYAGEEPVGFVMLSVVPQKAEYYLWRLMIDAAHQRRGYGKQALELVIRHVRTLPNANALFTGYRKGDGSPERFYLNLGFQPTGKVDDDDHILRLDLSDTTGLEHCS